MPVGQGLRVLLVEDSEDNRVLIEQFLAATPHHLEAAQNGAEAVSKVHAGRFDVILMDIQMPVMDGYAATRAIRVWERERGIVPQRILALTAHALDEDREKSREAGCDGHLSKPIRKRRLLAALMEDT